MKDVPEWIVALAAVGAVGILGVLGWGLIGLLERAWLVAGEMPELRKTLDEERERVAGLAKRCAELEAENAALKAGGPFR